MARRNDHDMTEAQALEHLRKWVDDRGTQQAAAAELELSRPYLNDILHGKRGLQSAMARIGYERVVTYRLASIPIDSGE